MTTQPPQPLTPKSRRVLTVAGIGAAVFVGFMWIRRSRTPSQPVSTPDDTTLPDATFPTVTTTTVPANVDVIDTNAKWTQRAVELLSSQGWDGATVSTALGKLLAHQALSSQQADIAISAKGLLGEPPVGGPYPIIPALPTPSGGTAAIKLATPSVNIRRGTVTGNTVVIEWAPVPNGHAYRVYRNGAVYRDVSHPALTVERRGSSYQVQALGHDNYTSSDLSNRIGGY